MISASSTLHRRCMHARTRTRMGTPNAPRSAQSTDGAKRCPDGRWKSPPSEPSRSAVSGLTHADHPPTSPVTTTAGGRDLDPFRPAARRARPKGSARARAPESCKRPIKNVLPRSVGHDRSAKQRVVASQPAPTTTRHQQATTFLGAPRVAGSPRPPPRPGRGCLGMFLS